MQQSRSFASERRATAKKALAQGKATAVTAHIMQLNYAGNCEQPYTIEQWGAAGGHTDHPGSRQPSNNGFGINIVVRCRKCNACRNARARLWAGRAMGEAAYAKRVWFGTLTFKPHCFQHLAHRKPDERFALGNPIAVKAMTNYIKRMRKSGLDFRYVYAVEPHKTGYPHIHILLFEKNTAKKRDLEAKWEFGFTKWKLCNNTVAAAVYCAKYMSKHGSRIKSSQRFGKKVFVTAAPLPCTETGESLSAEALNEGNGDDNGVPSTSIPPNRRSVPRRTATAKRAVRPECTAGNEGV